MLVVQPASTCDVCLERYAWDAPASELLSKPHVITCGHVFCHRCLQNLRTPRTCPLCRAGFHLTRAVRIHVDLASEDGARGLAPDELEARRFELRLAELSASSSATTTTADSDPPEGSSSTNDNGVVVEEALVWLENAPAESYPVLRSILASITRQKALSESLLNVQAEAARVRGERDHVRRHLRRAERAREQEQLLAQNSEKSWAVRVSEIERDCERKLTEAEAERRRLEDELAQCRFTLKDAHAAQADVLVQAQLQIHSQSQTSTVVPPHSPLPDPKQSIPQPMSITQDPPISVPAAEVQPQQQAQQVGPSAAAVSAIAFPRTSAPSPAPSTYDSSAYAFSSYNPLPRPPEPVPLSRLPAFARPRPGSSAYTAARALARHAHGHGRHKEERARENERGERSERKREREKERDRERDGEKDKGKERRRGKDREREGTGTDSGTGKERRRGRTGKERDRGTDTSATETQDRRRARTRHASLVGPSSSHAEQVASMLTNGVSYMSGIDSNATGQTDGRANGHVSALPAFPRDVVGGWGLERSWRASLASSTSGASAPVSREDLRRDFRETDGEPVGSSHTKMRVSKEKGKGKEREADARETEGAEEVREDYVFVRPVREEREHERRRERERERHSSFTPYPFESREAAHELPQSQELMRGRERERRTTLSAAPSALGLVLVPSPDGHGGYAYEYQYRTVPPQSTIQTDSASGKESVTPVAGANGVQKPNQHAEYLFAAPEMQSRASTASNATLTRRATDSHLQAQAHAMPSAYPIPRQPRASTTTALHVPQPRRISLTIPEPEAAPSPQPEPIQAQPPQSFRNEDTYTNHAYPVGDAYRDTYGQRNVGSGGLYANTNPSANMSLDSALASLSLAAGTGTGTGQQTLRHRTSDSSTASASTGISLTGTSGERRKQLLDALFTDTEPGSNRSSYASDANRVSIGQALDAAGGANGGAGEAVGGVAGNGGGPPAAAASAARGVPSRDGRPSRGLSTSTRPSTVHPIQSTPATTAARAPPSGATYAPLQQQQRAPTHVRQATYPPSTYTSTPAAYAAQQQGQASYTSNAGTGAGYQPQASAATPSAAAYGAYAAYYQSQSQGQTQPQQPSALLPPTGRFVDYRAQAAGAATNLDRR